MSIGTIIARTAGSLLIGYVGYSILNTMERIRQERSDEKTIHTLMHYIDYRINAQCVRAKEVVDFNKFSLESVLRQELNSVEKAGMLMKLLQQRIKSIGESDEVRFCMYGIVCTDAAKIALDLYGSRM